ncbi:hypothetical protein KIL84_014426 [Mauremys mutica]|uniref:Uncharacterized protein n=1 Tax=Mauremys mutica TaxID=74926 RepID=A0A9D4B804_9SAUR|nr:hypothetical protein KIL84_014426 [Mauremys mutica]
MAALHVAEVISHPSAQSLGEAPVLVKPPQGGMQQPELEDRRLKRTGYSEQPAQGHLLRMVLVSPGDNPLPTPEQDLMTTLFPMAKEPLLELCSCHYFLRGD